jgi:RNA polymerase sigma-70 factor (ECF subfamily)
VLGGQTEAADQAKLADERLVAGERRALLSAALETIPIERRAVIVMHDIDGLPIPEVAETLGIPANTAYSRLRLARAELATAVKRLRKRER